MDNPAPDSRPMSLWHEGRRLRDDGHLAEAGTCYRQALEQRPDDPALLREYADICARIGDMASAVTLLRRAADIAPNSGIEGMLGTYLARSDKPADAIPYLRRHLRGQPDDARSWLLLAQSFLQERKWAFALTCAARADQLAPSEKAMDIALECMSSLGLKDDVEACLAEALQRYPGSIPIQAHQGVHFIRQGHIREGLRLQPMIRKRFSPQRPGDNRIAARLWEGESFDGILLVSSEQGIGEEILAASFFPRLIAHGQPAVIECDPRLIPIFKRSFPGLRFLPPSPENAVELARDGTTVKRIKTLDLAPLLINDEDFQQPARWLKADQQRVDELRETYRQRWPGKLLVGFSWRSARELGGLSWKSYDMDVFLPLLALPGTVFVDVQYGGTAGERQAPCRHGLPALEHDPTIDPLNDLDGLLAQLCALDTLVTVSNSTAHLAGGAGVKAHVVLPSQPPVYAYWGYEGSRTAMYPSLQLWRPQEHESPEALTRALAQHLAGLIGDTSRKP